MAAALTLDEAQRLVQTCLDKARGMSLNVSIAVVDAAGIPIASVKMDRAGSLTPDVAYGKAFAAVSFRRSGKEMADAWGPGHPVAAAMVARTGGRFVAGQGSLLLRDGDDVAGAIGVSGARSDQDEEIAQAGVDSFRR